MNTLNPENPGKPAIVIIAAILNFFSTAAFFGMSLFCVVALLFGAAWGIDAYVVERMPNFAPNPNYSYGLAVLFGGALAVFLLAGFYFLAIGLGLLSGKKFAWYLQVAMSTLGVLSLPLTLMTSALMLPLGAVLNIVILVMFFQGRVRGYFKV